MSMTGNAPEEFKGRLAEGKDWREIVAWVGDLPPMPHVASRAISMVENPDTTASELTELLSSDAALAARVLKIANSAMFSRQREITTLNQAIMIIGFKALKGIIVAAALRQMNRKFSPLEQLIWENSMATAMCSTLIAKRLKKTYVEEIFLLGLLHGLGQIVLLARPESAKDYKNIMAKIKDEKLEFVEAEQAVMGFAHPLIGALVAKKWNFSAETCQVILHYKDQVQGAKPEVPLEEKSAVVQLADMFAHCAQIGSPEGYPDLLSRIEPLAVYVGFPQDKLAETIQEIVESTRKQFEAERQVYE
jgi:HD-like signal output (HDOD) protein